MKISKPDSTRARFFNERIMTEKDLRLLASEDFLRDRRRLLETLQPNNGSVSEQLLEERADAIAAYASQYSSVDDYPLAYFMNDEAEFQVDDFAKALASLCNRARPKMSAIAAEHAIAASMKYYLGEESCTGKPGDKVARWCIEKNEDVISRAAALTILGFLSDAVPAKLHPGHEVRLGEMVSDAKYRINESVLNSLEGGEDNAGFVYAFSPDYCSQLRSIDEKIDSNDNIEDEEFFDPDYEQREFLFRMGLVQAESPEKVELPVDNQEFPISHLGFPGYSLYCNIITETQSVRDKTSTVGTHYFYCVDIATPTE